MAEFVLNNNHSLIITNLIVLIINTYYFDMGTPTDPLFFVTRWVQEQRKMYLYIAYRN